MDHLLALNTVHITPA